MCVAPYILRAASDRLDILCILTMGECFSKDGDDCLLREQERTSTESLLAQQVYLLTQQHTRMKTLLVNTPPDPDSKADVSDYLKDYFLASAWSIVSIFFEHPESTNLTKNIIMRQTNLFLHSRRTLCRRGELEVYTNTLGDLLECLQKQVHDSRGETST